MGFVNRWLRKLLHYRDLGWEEIGEEFTRWTLFSTRWLTVYIHRLDAKVLHPQCHDHPWDFWAIVLWGGYYEHLNGKVTWKGPGSIFYRPAKSTHNVVTPGVSWSIIITGPKKREWGFKSCES